MNKTPTASVIDDGKTCLSFFQNTEDNPSKCLVTGHNCKKALESYQGKKPDIVFVDLAMPEYDGIFALRNIRKIDPKAKIIIITGNLQKDAQKNLIA